MGGITSRSENEKRICDICCRLTACVLRTRTEVSHPSAGYEIVPTTIWLCGSCAMDDAHYTDIDKQSRRRR